MPKMTQKAALAKARDLIDSYCLNNEFCPAALAILSDLTGTPIHYAIKRKNPSWPSDKRHLHVMAGADTQAHQWSWRRAVEIHHARDPDERRLVWWRFKVLRALRQAVQPDMDYFRKAQVTPRCAECDAIDDLTTDHWEPFHGIALTFLLNYPNLALREIPGSSDGIADSEIENKWIEFHRREASYQILCRRHNSSKGAA
jgi:hypothetical protein